MEIFSPPPLRKKKFLIKCLLRAGKKGIMMCLEIKAIKHLMLCTPVGKSIQMSQLDIHYPGTIKHGRTRGCPPQCLFVLRTYAHLKLANKTLNLGKDAKKEK